MTAPGGAGAAYPAAYDEQARARITAAEIAAGADRSGPVIRKIFPGERGLITYRDLAGLDGPGLDAFIAAQRDHFAGAVATTIPFVWDPPASRGTPPG
jgi:hypothetical protein